MVEREEEARPGVKIRNSSLTIRFNNYKQKLIYRELHREMKDIERRQRRRELYELEDEASTDDIAKHRLKSSRPSTSKPEKKEVTPCIKVYYIG